MVTRIHALLLAALTVLASACAADAGPDLSQSDSDALGGLDGVDFDTLGPNDVAIGRFDASHGAVTAGVTQQGTEVAGEVTLSWLNHAAATLELSADGTPLDLTGCEPTTDAPCEIAGRITFTPTASHTYTLRAVGADGSCGEVACPERTVRVDVLPPARVTLTVDRATVPAGVDLPVVYTVSDAVSFTIGRVVVEDGETRLDPCVPEDEATAESGCVLTPNGLAPLSEEGVAVFRDVQRDLQIGATADNGADDALGAVVIGDVTADITVPVEIRRFEVSPPQALPGTSVKISWVVVGADTVAVTAAPDELLGLGSCVGVNADGTGYCTVQLSPEAPLGPVRLNLTARQDDDRVSLAHTDLDVISEPTVASFQATPAATVPGQAVMLSWSVYGADAVSVEASSPALEGVDACTELKPSGDGGCTVHIAEGAAFAPIEVTVTASHGALGASDSASLTLGVGPAPEVVEAWVDDETVAPGDEVELHWVTENASSVTVAETSGVIATAELLACSGVDDDGEGGCTLTVPVELAPGPLALSVIANGPTGARSEAAAVSLTVNGPPLVTFSVSPGLLPAEGGEATLTWTATGADRVVINDDSGSGVRLVDTSVPTACDSGANCVPTADTITTDVTTSTVWTLRASNAYGSVSVAASVRLDGAPTIDVLTLAGHNLLSGNIITHQPTSGLLSWTLLGIDEGDLVSLERAPLPGRRSTCAAVDPEAWTLVSGFPVDGAAQGDGDVPGLSEIAECFRFTAQDTDEDPGQRDVTVFEVRKDPHVQTFATADTAAPGQSVTLEWTTAFAYEVALEVSPTGAVTPQDLGACTDASGSCEVTLQPETPLGELVFHLTAIGDGDAESQSQTALVDVGVAPTVTSFFASPASAVGPTEATLSWNTTAGERLTLTAGDEVVVDTTDPARIADGTQLVGPITSSRTWRLTVSNPFGEATATATTFIGPSIDALTAEGQNALAGQVVVPTGPVTVAWTTTNAHGEQALDVGAVPSGGACAGATFDNVFTSEGDEASGSHALGTVTHNRCVRLRVSSDDTAPQTSAAVFLLREVPEVGTISRTPSSFGSGGGNVTVTMGVRGGHSLALTATYLASDGTVLGTREVCDESSLSSGHLTNGAAVDSVSCVHYVSPCSLLCLNSGMPSATSRIHYRVVVTDDEGDQTTASPADVTVN